MPKNVTVEPGDCLSSIASKNGFHWRALWEDDANAALRKKRRDPNVLFPGDVVVIPERSVATESLSTDDSHVFQLKPTYLHLRLRFHGAPRGGEAYRLVIDGDPRPGIVQADGRIDEIIAGNAKIAVLHLVVTKEEYTLELGEVNPLDEAAGVEWRLRSLGFDDDTHEPEGAALDEETLSALDLFARRNAPPQQSLSDALEEVCREHETFATIVRSHLGAAADPGTAADEALYQRVLPMVKKLEGEYGC